MKIWEKNGLLGDLHRIENLLENNTAEDADLPIVLQNKIILCGTKCEKFSGTEKAVAMLESAAENCYLYYLDRQDMILKRIRRELKLARKELEKINCGKMLILFLPYKATLWNAMKSVYEKAICSKECRVCLMPIPYLDKGSFSDEKCEQEFFKSMKGYVDYRKFSFADHQPDVIFIHNPYDNRNTATTINSNFYSSVLKKYTRHLVYIPYDVNKRDQINEYMCVMPGVKNAWKVFVQSEKIRQKYIKYNEPEKIVAVGTPKFDFLKEQDNQNQLPLEWERKIGNRKVILCNIHIGRILNRVHEGIGVVERVMNYFEAKDMVLIYRPHPLLKEILKNTSYIEYENYIHILEQHSKSSNVIIDDSVEIERAVIRSDACIGDRGSMEVYFGVMGKPMYFFEGNLNISMGEIWRYLPAYHIEIEKDKAWFFLNNRYNLLCEFDFISKQSKCLVCIAEELEKRTLVDSVVKVDNKIILIPAESSYIRIFNIEVGSLHKYTLKGDSNNRYKYQRGECIDSKDIFLVPICTNYIIKIDIETEEIQYFEIDVSILKKLGIFNDPFFMGRGVINDEKVYLPAQYKPYLLKCYGNVTEYYKIGCQFGGFSSCIFDGKYFWLAATARAEIVRWNEESSEYIIYDNFPKTFQGKIEPLFIQIVKINQTCLWLIPYGANMILQMDTKKMVIEQVKCENKRVNELLQEQITFEGVYYTGEKIYLVPANYNAIVEIEIQTKKFLWHDVTEPNHINYAYEAMRNITDADYNYLSGDLSLDIFCNTIQQNQDFYYENRKLHYSGMIDNFDKNCGQIIFDYIHDKYLEEL